MTFYKNRIVLVTGAGGFVGSHLTKALLEQGAKVAAWVRGSSGSGAWRLAPHPNLYIGRVDVGDFLSVQSAWGYMATPSVVFHLAAQAHVGEGWSRPLDTIRSNILGTYNVLETARLRVSRNALQRVVVAGSSEEYGGVTGESESTEEIEASFCCNAEGSPLEPRSLYGAQRNPDKRDGARGYLESLCRLHNAKYHAPCEG